MSSSCFDDCPAGNALLAAQYIPATVLDVICDFVFRPIRHCLIIDFRWLMCDQPSYSVDELAVRKNHDVLRSVFGNTIQKRLRATHKLDE
jgi:hypothetical protein